jgi:hypothetical protein
MLTIGSKYLILTVTHYVVGEVIACTPTHATLKRCAWIPQTGNFNACLVSGEFEAVEPMLDGSMVPLQGSIISPWPHPLPTEVK